MPSLSDKQIVLNTVFERLSVTVLNNGRPEYHTQYYERKRNSFNVDKIISSALDICSVSADKLSAAYVFCGPGSFTGIKLGLSVMYGMIAGTNGHLKARGISLLDYLLYSAFLEAEKQGVKKGAKIAALIPGVKGEYFTKISELKSDTDHKSNFEGSSVEFVINSGAVINDMNPDFIIVDAAARLFFDDEKLKEFNRNKIIITNYSAENVSLFINYCMKYDETRFLELQPIYLKDTYATKPEVAIV